MKLRSTTPVSTKLAAKFVLVAAAVVMAISAPIQMGQVASAVDYDAQISAIEKEIREYRSQANRLGKEADSLKKVIKKLEAEKAIIQSQLDLSEAELGKLTDEIAETEEKIELNSEALGKIMADMYVDESISPLEMLASSNNISDYVDKMTYQSSVQDQLKRTIDTVKKLKAKLEKKKIGVERVIADQKSQKQSLVANEQERQAALAAVRGEEAAYNQLVNERAKEVEYLREQQRIAFAQLQTPTGTVSSSSPVGYAITYANFSGNVRCGGGYSYCNNYLNQWAGDSWGLNLSGQCVHYTADWLTRNGYYIPHNAFARVNGNGGNANEWIPTATRNGFASVVGTPQRGDVAYMPVPGVGHVGIVEENYGNGWVKVSQYNFAVYGNIPGYSTMDLKITNNVQFLRFTKR